MAAERTALITGITGQDGAYLANLLLDQGYRVVGGYRRASTLNLWRLEELGIRERVELVPLDLQDLGNVVRVLQEVAPDEVYNLAAQSFVGVSFEQPILTGQVTGLGAVNVLESIRIVDPEIRFYQASSSEMFGGGNGEPLDEAAPFLPRSPYAAAKAYAHHMTVNYREAYDMHASCGILFNHESPLRGVEFVTRKITDGVARIHLGLEDELALGNLGAARDWGFAGDYVEAMWRMLQQDEPGDFVVATGQAHTVGDFCEVAFSMVGLDWEDHVVTDARFQRPKDVEHLLGDASRARSELGWTSRTTFEGLVHTMLEADLIRLSGDPQAATLLASPQGSDAVLAGVDLSVFPDLGSIGTPRPGTASTWGTWAP